jgi:hypothetical protein
VIAQDQAPNQLRDNDSCSCSLDERKRKTQFYPYRRPP